MLLLLERHGGANVSLGGQARLVLLLIPGLDLRNLSAESTPFLHQAFRDFSWAKIETQPSPEQVSTLVTGMNPHDHGIWQMKRLEGVASAREATALFERFPDLLTTTWQCIRHQLRRDCDVPTLPPRRRKAFEMHRLKFHGRRNTRDLLNQLGAVPSVVSHLGTDRCAYAFTDRLDDFERVADRAALGEVPLEILQMHAVDMMGHWVLDTPEKRAAVYRRADALVERLAEQCSRRGIDLLALTDHGQEPVVASLDLAAKIEALDLDPSEFSYYLQPITARFWTRTERARERLTGLLEATPHGTLLSFADLGAFDIHFADASYGELYFIADPGHLFFPHDFHHPLVNLVFGLKDPQQRSRIHSPRHIAYHGYLPHHESERGWIVALNRRLQFTEPVIKLVDVMPSALSALGEAQPPFMTGRSKLEH